VTGEELIDLIEIDELSSEISGVPVLAFHMVPLAFWSPSRLLCILTF